jgi:ribosome-binding factor A
MERKLKKERDLQLAQLIFEELLYVFSTADDPILNAIKIEHVIPDDGGKHFLVLVTPDTFTNPANTAEKTTAHLEKAQGFIRSELALAINFKKFPVIKFAINPLQ